jgi:hypothetical protein
MEAIDSMVVVEVKDGDLDGLPRSNLSGLEYTSKACEFVPALDAGLWGCGAGGSYEAVLRPALEDGL